MLNPVKDILIRLLKTLGSTDPDYDLQWLELFASVAAFEYEALTFINEHFPHAMRFFDISWWLS